MNNFKKLMGNHLEFLRTHRGLVNAHGDHWLIESDKKEFNFLILGSDDILNFISLSTFYKTPWCNQKNTKWLSDHKKYSYSLSYMTLEHKNTITKPLIQTIQHETTATIQHIEDFSLVQGRGFCPTEESFNEWYPWMRSKNLANQNTKDQTFHVAYLDSKPSSVALTIKKEHILGIYAVSTIPEHRKKGLSSFLMEKIITQSEEIITLQVLKNSYAENFYQKLGFKTAFEIEVFSN